MPLEPLEGGRDFALAGKQVRSKINEIIAYLNLREQAKLTPSSNVGSLKPDGNIDLSQLDDRVVRLENK